MENLLDTATFQFLIEQFQLLISKQRGRRYNKHVLIIASELFIISPSAYRMVKRSKVIILQEERKIRRLLSKSLCKDNLGKLFAELKPNQRLANILFDEVKLKQSLRFVGDHIHRHTYNSNKVLATSVLVFEIICHHGGPRYILKVVPVVNLKGDQLKDMIMEVIYLVKKKGGGGTPVSLICDNYSVNQKVYKLLGGPGEVSSTVFVGYDYDHAHKKFEQEVIDTSEEISCDFIDKLSHGRLCIPTLNTVFFVYSAQHVYDKLDEHKKGCTSHRTSENCYLMLMHPLLQMLMLAKYCLILCSKDGL